MRPRVTVPGSDRPAQRTGERETFEFLLADLDVSGRAVAEFTPGPGVTVREIPAADHARAIRVNARSVAFPEWIDLSARAGFGPVRLHRADMALPTPKHNFRDEGLSRTAKVLFNLLHRPELRARVLNMPSTFLAHRDNLGGVGIIFGRIA
ncbi:hypothetical protein [Corynebacterium pacaense]|uniref:hypothetical protein n=1 Tax=Corynebacterium pacaense TaxID=1816684 RepID=UPI00117803AC|nr:hypothetical protein [Corynebacterium pacaense]